MLYGVLNLSWWEMLGVTFLFTQFTIMCVTLYLHRCQSHRSLSLHPLVSHVFRLWLWLSTGMTTKEWVAIHRKHHANTDEEGDPHSPKLFGIRKVLWEGAELYRASAKDKAMIEKYGHETPNDWIERNVYARFAKLGVALMLIVNLVLFGIPGLSIWAIQMLWIPFHAAGVINGIGHHFGYRNFESQDVSRNILPWGIWIGGEELHNNHHAFASSAKFSVRWWEFDIGWFYIQCLSFLGLAQVKKLPPQLKKNVLKRHIDLETVKALIANRLQVMANYYHQVIVPIVRIEKTRLLNRNEKRLLNAAKRLLIRSDRALSPPANAELQQVLSRFAQLKLVYQYGKNLQAIWMKTAKSQKDIVVALQNWCKQAEKSGLEVLEQFSFQIKQYV
ncbi:MAG: fatty acid desaturase [Gammaproteobacteria bacterium]|nr:fatty acid desaturase [Gammaproteobacteria bacterium]